MGKTNITRTYGPIHFEDLDPHRFEDLIRELIYDYKEWQNIEATGRSGGDDGFDVRAYEKIEKVSSADNGEEGEQEHHPMDGNLWMIQCKREKEVGPQKVASIISDTIDVKNPPYGYILAASANFSKEAYDVFRAELRKQGVMEFYLWGKAELEDMLHLPKNDRILFTFFGISLVSKRRSRSTEIRFVVNSKNKLYRIFEEKNSFRKSVLVRDLKDMNYPYKEKCKDFDLNPRWKEYIAYGYHPLGIWLHNYEYFAYVDRVKKEWDFTKIIDLICRNGISYEERRESLEIRQKAENFWEHFPKANQAKITSNGVIKFNEIAVIDEKGDVLYEFPHIFVDFKPKLGPFTGFHEVLKLGSTEIDLKTGYKRVKIFPEKLPEIKIGKVHRKRSIVWDEETLRLFRNGIQKVDALYDCDNKYDFLNPRDVIPVTGAYIGNEQEFIEITHKFKTKLDDYLKENGTDTSLKETIERQIGRKIKNGENLNVYEFRKTYTWEFEKRYGNKKSNSGEL